MIQLWVLTLLPLVLYICYVYAFASPTPNKCPPGPWKLPVAGHLLSLGLSPHETLLKWKKYYGPTVFVQFGSLPAVVISDGALIKAAFNLASLSGRPKIKYLDDMSQDRSGLIQSDGPAAREIRSFTQRKLKDLGYGSQSMEIGIREQISSLLEIFESHLNHPLPVKHCFSTVTLNYLLSLVIGSTNVDDGHGFQEFGLNVSELITFPPLFALTLFLPKLAEWFPGLTGYKHRMDLVNKNLDFISLHIQRHEETRLHGQPRDLIDCYLDERDSMPQVYSKKAIVVSLWELLLAGVETTSTSLEWIIYYLVKYPEVQGKVFQEINSTIGTQSVPSSSDRPRLPYCEAMLQEVMRKSTAIPLAWHSALEDTKFQGFLIKKDWIVAGNLYAANHDPVIWGDPENFRPQRFLNEDGKLNEMDAHLVHFSMGKRKCIGENLARNQLFLFTVSILQKYRLEAAGDLPSDKCEAGISRGCAPFFVNVCGRH